MFIGIRRRLGLTVALGLAAVGLTGGVFAASADAAIGVVRARLTAEYDNPKWDTTVEGVVKMSQGEAQGLIESGHKVVVRVWGEDPFFDDLLLGPYHLTQARGRFGYIAATPQGLAFHVNQLVNKRELNEDHAFTPGGINDEIYAGVRLVNSDGATIRSGETNRLGSVDFWYPFGPPVSTCPANYVDC